MQKFSAIFLWRLGGMTNLRNIKVRDCPSAHPPNTCALFIHKNGLLVLFEYSCGFENYNVATKKSHLQHLN